MEPDQNMGVNLDQYMEARNLRQVQELELELERERTLQEVLVPRRAQEPGRKRILQGVLVPRRSQELALN